MREAFLTIMFKTQECSFLWHFQRSGSLVGIQNYGKMNLFIAVDQYPAQFRKKCPQSPQGSPALPFVSHHCHGNWFVCHILGTVCKGKGACCVTAARWKQPNKHLFTRLTKDKTTNIKVDIFSTVSAGKSSTKTQQLSEKATATGAFLTSLIAKGFDTAQKPEGLFVFMIFVRLILHYCAPEMLPARSTALPLKFAIGEDATITSEIPTAPEERGYTFHTSAIPPQ